MTERGSTPVVIVEMDNMQSEKRKMPKTELTPELSGQITAFVDGLQRFNDQLPEHARRKPENYKFLRGFVPEVVAERNHRAKETTTPEYQATVDLARSLFPMPNYNDFCMDGRVLPPLVFLETYGIGSSLRVPGGIINEFVWAENGEMILRKDSSFSKRVDSALLKFDTIAEVFDSHVGCAARNKEEEARGHHPHDSGLLKDVLHKKEMARATKKYTREKYGDSKEVITIQTSFDPHTGFMYMGLDSDKAIDFVTKTVAKDKEPEYTSDVLQELVDRELVISTKQLTEDPYMRKLLEEHGDFVMDWENNYADTASRSWNAIAKMKGEAEPIIMEKLKKVYPHLRSDKPDSKKELQERAMLALLNTFSGFMLNKDDLLAGAEDANYTFQAESYAFGTHKEALIKVYEGGHPPYPTSAFVLDTDEKNLPSKIELAASLVRGNRKAGRVEDPTSSFANPDEFEKAVVPVMVHEIVREPIAEEEWNEMSKIDWSDLSTDWNNMKDEDFNEYLVEKGVNNYQLMRNINNLRRRMAVLFDPDVPTSHHFTQQFKVAVPTIMSRDRQNRFLIPFVKLGY